MISFTIIKEKIRAHLHSYSQGLVKALSIHVTLSLFSLPVLLTWGLPFSPWGIFGNLIFAPFLSLFLLLASGLFFTELLQIPNAFLAQLLEQVSTLWQACIRLTPGAILELPSPSYPLALFMLIVAAVCIHSRTITLSGRILFLTILMGSFCAYVYLTASPPPSFCDSLLPLVTFLPTDKGLICIDRGTSMRPVTCQKKVQRIVPLLKRRYAASSIRMLIFLKPTTSSIELAHLLLAESSSATIILPLLKGKENTTLAKSLGTLKAWCHQNSHTVITVQGSYVLIKEPTTKLRLTVHGTLPRTAHAAQALLTIGGRVNAFSFKSAPLITRRERALLQRLPKQEVNR